LRAIFLDSRVKAIKRGVLLLLSMLALGGQVLYQSATGQRPFEEMREAAIAHRLLTYIEPEPWRLPSERITDLVFEQLLLGDQRSARFPLVGVGQLQVRRTTSGYEGNWWASEVPPGEPAKSRRVFSVTLSDVFGGETRATYHMLAAANTAGDWLLLGTPEPGYDEDYAGETVLHLAERHWGVTDADPQQAFRKARARWLRQEVKVPVVGLALPPSTAVLWLLLVSSGAAGLVASNARQVLRLQGNERAEPWILLDNVISKESPGFARFSFFMEQAGGLVVYLTALLTPSLLSVGSAYLLWSSGWPARLPLLGCLLMNAIVFLTNLHFLRFLREQSAAGIRLGLNGDTSPHAR
jgi:hypothetical protein